MSVTIEARPYGPDSTPEEVSALRDRITMRQGVMIYREAPVMSEFQLDVYFDRVEELLREHSCNQMIVDLQHTKRPNAELRQRLRSGFKQIGKRIERVAVAMGGNYLLRVSVKFVFAGLPQRWSVHKTFEEAEEALQNAGK